MHKFLNSTTALYWKSQTTTAASQQKFLHTDGLVFRIKAIHLKKVISIKSYGGINVSIFISAFQEYLLREACNFISVDWSVLASGDYTFVAINNVPVAGAATGAFVDFLVSQGTPLSAFHLIGFSMGVSHVFY